MNKFILCVLDRENKTKEELEINADAAAGTRAAYRAAYFAHSAAAAATYDAGATYDAEYWLNKYFEAAGESREEYEKVIKEKR
jgi:hypothetical protein